MGNDKLSQTLSEETPLKFCGAVILAAGTASRMKGIDKVMAELCGEPMVLHTVRRFQNCDVIGEIVIVTREDLVGKIQTLCADFSKVKAVSVGGADRVESAMKGLKLFSDKVRLVAVHDAARPLITEAVIERTVRAANRYGAAAPGVPVKDTVKIVEDGFVKVTPDRSTLQAVQTPQIFELNTLTTALEKAKADGATITDDCSAVERLGVSIQIVEGDERNMKVTTPIDIKVATSLLEDM